MRIMRNTITVLLLAIGLLSVSAKSKDDDDAKAHKVTIHNLKYDPAKLTIKTGETVVWTNTDDNDHTVISDDKEKDAPLFASDNLGNGDKFKFTFDKKGKFAYHCKYHPRMKGVVFVAD